MPKATNLPSARALIGKEYFAFLAEIKEKFLGARLRAYQSVSRSMIRAYWEVGKGIVERQERHGWGKRVVERLAGDLRREFPGTSGFSSQNLWYMRKFYLAYRGHSNLQQLAGEIPWFTNVAILDKVSGTAAREYYLQSTAELGWSRNVLIHQIEVGAYERHRTAPKQNNFPRALPKHMAEQAGHALKDGYVLDFLGSRNPLLERDLQRGLLAHIRDFLVELGIGFCFVGNEYRLTLKDKEYFVDLLFFHRHLRCLVAIELKIGEFKPEYAGKMNFYLNLLDDHVRLPEENPSIGIILCKTRDRLEVEYALRGVNKPMGVSQYTLSKKPPKQLVGELPSPEQLKQSLQKDR
jgi:predicted nuclease of restriction endonuclease-like (RecB) superfamily